MRKLSARLSGYGNQSGLKRSIRSKTSPWSFIKRQLTKSLRVSPLFYNLFWSLVVGLVVSLWAYDHAYLKEGNKYLKYELDTLVKRKTSYNLSVDKSCFDQLSTAGFIQLKIIKMED